MKKRRFTNVLHAKMHHHYVFLKGILKPHRQEKQGSHEPIDFVVSWVDGNDIQWRKEKEKFWLCINNEEVSQKGNGTERYREWDQFMYWFRSVEKFAPWVRNIYLVTCGHLPPWLNTKHPKLKIVRHNDYMNAKDLPTFQSVPIEINLYRIQGLSENFVYFNDDMVLTKPVFPTDFFLNGIPKHCAIAYPVRNYSENGIFAHQCFSVVGLLNDGDDFEKNVELYPEKWFNCLYGLDVRYNWLAYNEYYLPGLYFNHLAYPLCKKTMKAVWERFPQQMKNTSSHKFRTSSDITTQIFTMYDIIQGNFIPVPKDHYGKAFHSLSTEAHEVAEAIRTQKYKMICYNDSVDVTSNNFAEIKTIIGAAWDSLLPEKSSFEI